MKLLLLDDTYREWLCRRRAIGLDSNLNEKLAGLSHEESIVYLAISEHAGLRLRDCTDEELERFICLYERHNSSTEFIVPPDDVSIR